MEIKGGTVGDTLVTIEITTDCYNNFTHANRVHQKYGLLWIPIPMRRIKNYLYKYLWCCNFCTVVCQGAPLTWRLVLENHREVVRLNYASLEIQIMWIANYWWLMFTSLVLCETFPEHKYFIRIQNKKNHVLQLMFHSSNEQKKKTEHGTFSPVTLYHAAN